MYFSTKKKTIHYNKIVDDLNKIEWSFTNLSFYQALMCRSDIRMHLNILPRTELTVQFILIELN